MDFWKRYLNHPVMGTFTIILLATIASVGPVYFWVSPGAAQWVSIGGQFIALIWAVGCVTYDAFLRRRKSL